MRVLNQKSTNDCRPILIVCIAILLSPMVLAEAGGGQKAGAEPRFGSPEAVENRMERDPDRNWKSSLAPLGFSLGADYTSVTWKASESPGEDEAWGGMARFFGTWSPWGVDADGALTFKVEHRHRTGDIPPQHLASELGYVGLISPPFSKEGWRVTNLYWRQRFQPGRTTVVAGFLDATDYVDVYALASPWTGFSNFAFSTGTQTIPIPNDAALGVAVASMLTEQVYLIGSLSDLNGNPTKLADSVNSFVNDHEYFKSLEIGMTTSHDMVYLDNVHLTAWHADERKEAVNPAGWGMNFSYSRLVGEKWIPFLRAGYADEGGSLLETSVSFGAGFQAREKDMLGFAFHWGRPNESTFGAELRDQYVAEIYYKWTIADVLEITPDVQLILDPALNPEASSILVAGLRLRALL